MKQEIDEKSRKSLVDYRLQRAFETLEEVPYLYNGGYYNTAINRMYYAVYYAVLALLTKNHIDTTTHSGVKQMLGLHFVITGKLSRNNSRIFNDLFDMRHSSDYEDFAYYERQDVDELLPKAKECINAISKLINE